MKPNLNLYHPDANMYGCFPCPKCKSEYRWPTRDVHPTDPNTIICDQCGHREKITGVAIFGER